MFCRIGGLADSSPTGKQGYRSIHKTGVQIKYQIRGTDQGNLGKIGVQINFPGGENKGTDQFFRR